MLVSGGFRRRPLHGDCSRHRAIWRRRTAKLASYCRPGVIPGGRCQAVPPNSLLRLGQLTEWLSACCEDMNERPSAIKLASRWRTFDAHAVRAEQCGSGTMLSLFLIFDSSHSLCRRCPTFRSRERHLLCRPAIFRRCDIKLIITGDRTLFDACQILNDFPPAPPDSLRSRSFR